MNKFYINSPEDIIVDVDQMFNVKNGVIYVGVEDIHNVVSGCTNTIVLMGTGSGSNRISNAIEDAVMHTCSVASEYDLFSAEKIILKISYPSSSSLMIAEFSEVIQFAKMFMPNTNFIWGVSEIQSFSSDLLVQIIASNIHPK